MRQILREPQETPVESETIEVKSNSTDKLFGRLIVVPIEGMEQKVKCVCTTTNEESFVYNINGRLYMDFDCDIVDVQTEGNESVILVK